MQCRPQIVACISGNHFLSSMRISGVGLEKLMFGGFGSKGLRLEGLRFEKLGLEDGL